MTAPGSTAKPIGRAFGAAPDVIDAAKVRFQRLATSRKRQILAELLQCRGDELMRAYPALIAIGHGRRRKRPSRRHKTGSIVANEWCILFMVRKKWKRADEDPTQRLPAYLLHYETLRGRRTLVAVPTDVDERPLVEAQAKSLFITVNAESPQAAGVLACLVRCRSTAGNVVWRALSCRHVLSLTNMVSDEVRGAEVFAPDHAALGTASSIRGPFEGVGFDAQAMDVANLEATKRALWTWQWPGGSVTEPEELGQTTWLRCARRAKPLQMTYRAVWAYHEVEYGPRHARFAAWIGPLVEVEGEDGESTIDGDSGSPLVIGSSTPKFAGMHIAADTKAVNGRYRSYYIPAYALLDPSNYEEGNLETWSLPG